MGIYFVSVNYWAVLASAIASMIIGSLWYGPLFGKKWMKLMNFTGKDISKAKSKGMWKLYLVNFIGSLITAFVLAHITAYVNAGTFMQGIGVGAWVWLGFVATMLLGSVLWEGKPVSLYWLNSIYWLVNLAVMGGILSAWA